MQSHKQNKTNKAKQQTEIVSDEMCKMFILNLCETYYYYYNKIQLTHTRMRTHTHTHTHTQSLTHTLFQLLTDKNKTTTTKPQLIY